MALWCAGSTQTCMVGCVCAGCEWQIQVGIRLYSPSLQKAFNVLVPVCLYSTALADAVEVTDATEPVGEAGGDCSGSESCRSDVETSKG